MPDFAYIIINNNTKKTQEDVRKYSFRPLDSSNMRHYPTEVRQSHERSGEGGRCDVHLCLFYQGRQIDDMAPHVSCIYLSMYARAYTHTHLS